MEKTSIEKKCFVSKDGKKLLCNAVDLHGDGQLWRPKSKKWIPLEIEKASDEDAVSTETI